MIRPETHLIVVSALYIHGHGRKWKLHNDKSINGVIRKLEVARHDTAIMYMHAVQYILLVHKGEDGNYV